MTATARTIVAVIALTLVAAAAGVWVGLGIAQQGRHHSSSLDEILHHELGLSLEQEKQIEALETKFALERNDLEMQMRAANLELARALEKERGYGNAAKTAISHFHEAMAKLQEQTILHVLEMRAVLTPDQAARFDRTIQQALAGPP